MKILKRRSGRGPLKHSGQAYAGPDRSASALAGAAAPGFMARWQRNIGNPRYLPTTSRASERSPDARKWAFMPPGVWQSVSPTKPGSRRPDRR
ncbi:MAG TPA: hypothetical protein PKD26_14125 [Pyrinomonadaceae bacterium]|nr:hypothetical protein [Pyrinomonadaceae bacterium]